MENTDKIQDKVVSMLDALQQGAATVGDKVVKYTPDVVDAGLWVIRIDGIQSLVFALVGLCIAAFIFSKIKVVYKFAKQKDPRFDTPLPCSPYIMAVSVAVLLIINISTLVTVWNWIAIFEPKLYLAKQIIDAATK